MRDGNSRLELDLAKNGRDKAKDTVASAEQGGQSAGPDISTVRYRSNLDGRELIATQPGCKTI